MEDSKVAARDRILKILLENPDGVSKRELGRLVGCNQGILRKHILMLRDRGFMEVNKVDRPYGETGLHKLTDAGVVEARGMTGAGGSAAA